ncbi:GNAT family N-acetyltransferase [Acidocella sp.]|jgi:ribosomal protein S18 acetylase RimI-like enzyme|uniref:GNAT family N-acetyltransferase n=1 Tax=Acidocella sp. TaxID=50710 RepID=UPI002F41C1E0
MFTIRPVTEADHDALWAILEPVIRAGETYPLPRDMSKAHALAYWTAPDHETFAAAEDTKLLGTYYLRANQTGNGAHVANCGYMTAPGATGRGIARAMCEHSLATARARGFAAMQFNLVVSTNERAVKLWTSMGFATLCRLPGAFRHPTHGDVDALLMFQKL